jgi:hypothetical protein
MTRLATAAVVTVVLLGVALMFVSEPVLLGVGLAGLTGLGVWQLGRCHHPRPLALLPPVVAPSGERTPAHWFCAGCGRTWPAFVDRPRPPIQVFRGHDESKAREAAKRAAAFDGRRRELAVQRAGLKKPAVQQPRRPAAQPVPIQPVSIHRVAR